MGELKEVLGKGVQALTGDKEGHQGDTLDRVLGMGEVENRLRGLEEEAEVKESWVQEKREWYKLVAEGKEQERSPFPYISLVRISDLCIDLRGDTRIFKATTVKTRSLL